MDKSKVDYHSTATGRILVCSTEHFEVQCWEKPHVDRGDGGHLVIMPRERVEDRTCLSVDKAFELMLLTMIVGEAMSLAMNRRGVDIGRINYQDNGNWGVNSDEGPYLHVHLYGRARSAKIQKYGSALFLPDPESGFYSDLEPLNLADISEVRKEIASLVGNEKYSSRIAAQFELG